MEQLKTMKEAIMCQVQGQLNNLYDVDAKELGEAIDMIKDLSEAIYYCTVTEAMEGKEEKGGNTYYYTENRYPSEGGRMYYSGGNSSSQGRGYYTEREMPLDFARDYREGRSGSQRRMYMESKEMHHGKEKEMKELEKYIQDLSTDITEMIKDATPDEKRMLQNKLTTLATKVGA